MVEQLRLLGVEMGMTGTGIMEKMMKGEVVTSELCDEQIRQVLAAWDTRNFVPSRNFDDYIKKGMRDFDIVRPIITKEDVAKGTHTKQEYDRNYVEMIEKYLRTLL